MADEPAPDDNNTATPWITVQILAPSPNARWAALNGTRDPSGATVFAAVAVDFMALQHQRDVLEGETEDDAPIEAVVDWRLVPLVMDTNGTARLLVPGVIGFVGLAATEELALSLAAAFAGVPRPTTTTTTTPERKDTDGP